MNVLNVRVDDRLVHGIVATMWLPNLKAKRVICIDDQSAMTPLMKNSLRMATPNNVFLSVLTFDKALENLLADHYKDEPVMIVVKTPETIVRLNKGGFNIKKITLGNLGNISRTTDSVTITRFITINRNDYLSLKTLHDNGVEISAQLSPEDNEDNNFYQEMNEKYKGE